MKAAIVAQAGSLPVYGDFNEPVPSIGESSIAVTAAALSPVVKGRVSGAHYSSLGDFPFVAGIDGVGRLDDGRRVYFILPKAPYGSMAERAAVPALQCVPLPDGLDDVTAAAIANPGLSSWAALKERARLAPGETVLVNGATGTSGRLAVQIAKYLGVEESHRNGPQCRGPAIVEGPRRRRDNPSCRKCGCARWRLQRALRGRRRRRARLSLGQKRRASFDCRSQGRKGRRPDSFRPDRQRQRRPISPCRPRRFARRR